MPWKFNETDVRFLEMKNRTIAEIEKAIYNGYKNFLCGMALGFDLMCAEIVLEFRKQIPSIKLIAAIPCREEDKLWKPDQQKRYKSLLKQSDEIRCIYNEYVAGCMLERNRYMINSSSLCIALFNGLPGGTKSTIQYAQKQGLKLVEIKP